MPCVAMTASSRSPRSPATSDGLGHGLLGIGERVKIYGGEMSTRTAVTGGFTRRA